MEGWKFDKRVPVALILALAIQTGGAIWWAASYSTRTDERLSNIEKWIAQNNETRERLAVLETQLKDIKSGIDRVERALRGGR